jgi:hypothetical protein
MDMMGGESRGEEEVTAGFRVQGAGFRKTEKSRKQ